MRLGSHIAKGEKNGIAGVVVLGVEIPQLLVGQVRNVLWIASAIKVISIRGEKLMAKPVPENGRRR